MHREPWSKLFSDDLALQRAVQGALKVLAGYIVLDSLQCTIAGTIRGCGRQMAAAPIVLVYALSLFPPWTRSQHPGLQR